MWISGHDRWVNDELDIDDVEGCGAHRLSSPKFPPVTPLVTPFIIPELGLCVLSERMA